MESSDREISAQQEAANDQGSSSNSPPENLSC